MAHIVVLGAGLGGTIMAYELKDALRKEDRITVVSKGGTYSFIPSNPWVAVGWRESADIQVDLVPVFERRGIAFRTEGAKRLHPDQNRIEMNSGPDIDYDFLVIGTGPELAFDEIEGFGPAAHTNSICEVGHAVKTRASFETLAQKGGPAIIGAAQGASCFGPAYEFAFTLDTALRRLKARDKVPMTFVTPEPYIGHLGLDGVGDTKGLLESARVKKVDANVMQVEEVGEDGALKKTHELPFAFSMLLPAFRGVEAVRGIEGLTNPRGFILADKHQRNPKFRNIFSIGVCVAIPPTGPTPVPCGVPKTGFMIESMVTATAKNIGALVRGEEARTVPSWNAICLADFGDGGIAFVAQPQIPPRNVNWSSQGKWVHTAKVGFEKYFLRKIRQGKSETFYEKLALDVLGISKLKEIHEEIA